MRRAALLGFLLILAAAACAAASALECDAGADAAAADRAFQYYADETEPFWKELREQRSSDGSLLPWEKWRTAMTGGRNDAKLSCMLLFKHLPEKHDIVLESKWFTNNVSCEAAMEPRIYGYQVYFSWLARQPQLVGRLRSRFRFYVELTAAAVLPDAAYTALRHPLLTPSRSPWAPLSMPVPESYIVYAAVMADPEMRAALAALNPALEAKFGGWARGIADVFGQAYGYTPWADKKAVVLYRGNCYPTVNPRPWPRPAPVYLTVRGDLCQAVQAVQRPALWDVAIAAKPGCAGNLCATCAPCNRSGEWMTVSEQGGHKYLLNVDGIAATADALYWKLGSGSAVFQLVPPGNGPYPLYVQWVTPLLAPYRNYVPVPLEGLEAAVHWCTEHDAACAAIGEAGRRTGVCEVTYGAARRYMERTLRLLDELEQQGR